MILVRRSEERRHLKDKDRKSWKTFDWENNSDPLRDGYGILKILDEEILSPGRGFTLHTHKNMVIVTYVREGVIIYKGPLEKSQLMENDMFHHVFITTETTQYTYNVSRSEVAHVFQAGFEPHDGVLTPGGAKKLFPHAERVGKLKLIASPDGRDSSLPIQQDVHIYSTAIHRGARMVHEFGPGRNGWLHVVKGAVRLNELDLREGDGVGISGEEKISFSSQCLSEILLFDLCETIPNGSKTGAAAITIATSPDPSHGEGSE